MRSHPRYAAIHDRASKRGSDDCSGCFRVRPVGGCVPRRQGQDLFGRYRCCHHCLGKVGGKDGAGSWQRPSWCTDSCSAHASRRKIQRRQPSRAESRFYSHLLAGHAAPYCAAHCRRDFVMDQPMHHTLISTHAVSTSHAMASLEC